MTSNTSAFLQMIKRAEHGKIDSVIYRTIVGGSTFSDMSKHPKILITLRINGRSVPSTAAGAYQFIYSTWERLRKKLKLPDFSPASQDKAAIELITEQGAYDDIQSGNFAAAVQKVSDQWASLAGSTANQNPKSLAVLKQYYTYYGGKVA